VSVHRNRTLRASLGQYIDFKVFSLFRDQLWGIIKPYTADELDEAQKFKHIFLAPASLGKTRSFQVSGVQYPYVALWATSALSHPKSDGYSAMYALSSVNRELTWDEPNPACVEGVPCDTCLTRDSCEDKSTPGKIKHIHQGFIQHFERTYELSCASYFRTFIEEVNQQVLELDRLRYVQIPFLEIHPFFKVQRSELYLKDLVTSENLNESQGQRYFQLACKYTFRCTLPIIPAMQPEMLNRLIVFLNENKIYEREWTTRK